MSASPSTLKQNTDEWYKFRQKHIGGSDAPVIMGVSPWKTPYQLWIEKVGPLVVKPANPAQQRGLDLEDKARKFFEDQTGYKIEPEVRVHLDHKWMMGSFDGFSKDGRVAAEIKCPGVRDHEIACDGEIPEKYKPQLQHLLVVSGLDMIYYISFDGVQGVIIEVERDENYIADLIVKELEFYNRMLSLTPPALTEKDVIQRDDKEWSDVVDEYKAVKSSLKYFEKRESDLRDKLIRLAGDHCTEGAGIRLTKYVRQGVVSYSMIPELKQLNLDVYRKPSTTCWKIGEV